MNLLDVVARNKCLNSETIPKSLFFGAVAPLFNVLMPPDHIWRLPLAFFPFNILETTLRGDKSVVAPKFSRSRPAYLHARYQ